MNYQDWLRLVESALVNGNRGFRVIQIDPIWLNQMFSAGQSPVFVA